LQRFVITADAEYEAYLIEPPIQLHEDPLVWWRTNRDRFPTIARLARKYLAIPATSVTCERIFSDAGNIITKKRSRLTADIAVAMIFLHENAHYWKDLEF